MEKKILIIRDMDDNDPIGALIVDAELDSKKVQEDIEKIIQELNAEHAGEWYTSDVMERLEFEYDELPIDSVFM